MFYAVFFEDRPSRNPLECELCGGGFTVHHYTDLNSRQAKEAKKYASRVVKRPDVRFCQNQCASRYRKVRRRIMRELKREGVI